ncbi:flagellar basal-body MS-ring/collar protein FliF [Vagococcus sp.]|uniref:flagellar basal-body MS-ring/collar protein FliF n=1 Tax=Vagococcus sp. TaxID=1933889 RepID=UPI003F9C4EF8
MMDKLQNFGQQFLASWRKLAIIKKVIILTSLVSFFIVLGATLYFSQRTNYTTLFQGLTEAESGVIVEDLETKGIKYKMENNGTKLLVDEKEVDKFRIELAVDNKMPKSSTGFEIFDDTGMMTTDEDRKIMYQRAVTGELERSIASLESVEKAKVMLVLPDRSIFEEKDKEATASIVLNLSSTGSIDDSTIKGIASLTSGAVENLPIKNVKIVDGKGIVLSDSLVEDNNKQATDLVSKYQGIKREYETSLEKKTATLLEAVFDPEKVKLSINADLDFDSIEKTSVTYGDTKVRSESVNASGDRINQQQVQGGNIQDNVANVVGNNNNNGNKGYQRNINNEVDTETTKILSAPGVVKRLSASVLINQNLSNAEKDRLEQAVRSAIGYDAKRGDAISIQGMSFSNEEPQEETSAKEGGLMNALQKKGSWLVIGIIVIVLLTIAILLLRKKAKTPELSTEEEVIDVSQDEEVVDIIQTIKEEPEIIKPEQPVVQEKPSISKIVEEKEKQLKKDDIRLNEENEKENEFIKNEESAKKYAKENPEVAAELIKLWMKEK